MKMHIKNFSILIFTILLFPVFLQAQKPEWAKALETSHPANCQIWDIETDTAGNVFVGGIFIETVDFDPGAGTSTKFGGTTPAQSYTAKYDKDGNFLWVVHITGGESELMDLTVDEAGNVYLAGEFRDFSQTYDFDQGTGINTISSVSNDHGFVAKYDANGNFQWVFDIEARIEAIDSDTNYFVIIGSYDNTVDFDPGAGQANMTVQGTAHRQDVYVAKYDLNGNYLSVFDIPNGKGSSCRGKGIKIDKAHNIILRTDFKDTVYADASSPSYTDIIPSSEIHAFLVKYDGSGNFQWSINLGENVPKYNNVQGTINVDGNGDVYACGFFSSPNDFDPSAGTAILTNSGSADGFVAKYSSSGNFLWAFQIGGQKYDVTYSVRTDTCDNLFVTGLIEDSVIIDKTGTKIYSDKRGFFLSKYTSNGDLLWATSQDPAFSSSSFSTAMSIDLNNEVIIGGRYSGDLDVDNSADNITLPSGNGYLFFSKFNSLPADTPTITSPPTTCAGDSVTLTISSGELNSASDWYWYTNSCGGTLLGAGTSLTVFPTTATTYFVRGEAACIPSGPCGQVTVNVNPTNGDASFSYASSDFCLGEPNPVPTIQGDPGGSFSINAGGTINISSGEIDLAASGLGIYDIIYLTSGSNCPAKDTFTVNIHSLTDATITSIPPLCENASSFTLTAANTGGTWNGAGITDINAGTFSPSLVGAGNWEISYTLSGGNCTTSDTISVRVNASPEASFSADSVCEESLTNFIAQDNGDIASWEWNFGDGSANSSASAAIAHLYSSAGNYQVKLLAISDSGCVDSLTQEIIVDQSPQLTLPNTASFCAGDSITLDAGNNFSSYQWSTGETVAAITVTTPGVYALTVTNNAKCEDSASVTVSSTAAPNASILNAPESICTNDASLILTTATAGGIWSGNGITNTSTGEFSPSTAGTGTSEIIYTITIGNCHAADTVSITVNEPAAISLGNSVQIDQGDTVTLSPQTPGGNNYLWTPSNHLSCSDCIYPKAYPNANTTYCIAVTDVNTCISSACIDIVVNDTINLNPTPCGELFIPTGFSPNFDQKNDELCVYGTSCLKSFTLIIYDRWGKKIVESTDPQFCWDGTFKGKPLNTAVFAYSFTAISDKGEKITRAGNISLIR